MLVRDCARTMGLCMVCIGANYAIVDTLDRYHLLRAPQITRILLLGVGGMIIPIGAGVCFYRYSYQTLIGSGLVRNAVMNSWKQKTVWAGKPLLTGAEIKPIVCDMLTTGPLDQLLASKAQISNPFLRKAMGMMDRNAIKDALTKTMESFQNTERMVADRITNLLVQTVEEPILARIHRAQDHYLYVSLFGMVSSMLFILAFDRVLILDSLQQRQQGQKSATRSREQDSA